MEDFYILFINLYSVVVVVIFSLFFIFIHWIRSTLTQSDTHHAVQNCLPTRDEYQTEKNK